MRATTASALLITVLAAGETVAAFRYERPVIPAAAGANRLDVDAALLSRAQRGMTDLRLFAGPNELSYLLIEPSSSEPETITPRTLPIASTKTTSGFEADLGEPRSVDQIAFEGIAAPFLKRVRIEGSGDRAHWTLAADATIWDLPAEKLRNHEVPFAAGEYRYLRVTWDDRSSARVIAIPAVRVRLHGTGTPPEPLRVAVPFRKLASEPGKSRYRITLPGPRLPLQFVEVQVASGNVFRTAEVTEPRLQGARVAPVTLGGATLRRAERGGGVAAELEIPITPPDGRDLDLAIDDGNNAPLAITAIVAHLAPQPWIYFETSDTSPLTARYGDPSLPAPRYDLEASRKYAISSQLPRATWRGGEEQTAATPRESDAAVPPFGAEIDRASFGVSRPLPDAPRGLTRLLLDADVLARSNQLADVRIVDPANRQVPYLLETRAEPVTVELPLPRRQTRDGRSVYRLALPYHPLPYGSQLVVETTARVFSREVELREGEDRRTGRTANVLAAHSWGSAVPEAVPPPLIFDAPALQNVELLIDEGDNAPLPISRARLLLPASALRFHHPGGELTLLYGSRNTGAPRYDLALLAPRLFGESARDLALPSAPPKADAPEGHERTFFWVAIGGAALVLLALLARLLRADGAEETRPLGGGPGSGDPAS